MVDVITEQESVEFLFLQVIGSDSNEVVYIYLNRYYLNRPTLSILQLSLSYYGHGWCAFYGILF